MHALEFATSAHAGQKRKYTFEDYITHPIAISEMVGYYLDESEKYYEEAVTAALLHDVVEDTLVTIEQIRDKFGPVVAKFVWFLTDPDVFVGNRAERKALTNSRLALAPREVKVIKHFDIIHNKASIEKYDPDFAVKFNQEKAALYKAMGKF